MCRIIYYYNFYIHMKYFIIKIIIIINIYVCNLSFETARENIFNLRDVSFTDPDGNIRLMCY